MPLLLSRLAPWSAILIACGPSTTVGLANAPAAPLASVVDSRPDDVVANGPGSCDRGASGASPLRGRTPACARAERASSDARAFAPRARTPLVTPHLPCWAADPWPTRATPASLASCEQPVH